MREKCKNLALLLLPALFLFGFSVWSLVKKDDTVSVSERRDLAQLPSASVSTVLSGSFMEEFERYTLDQFPLRDRFRTLKALTAVKLLRQSDNNGLYLQDGSAVKLDYPLDADSVSSAASRFEALYTRYLQGTDCRIYLSVIPDKNYYTDERYPKMDYAALKAELSAAMPYADDIDLTDLLTLDSYYRTDPHWRQEALTETASRLAERMDAELPAEFRTVRLDTPFYGAYYGQAALPLRPDTLCYLTNDVLDRCRVFDYEADAWTTLYDETAASSADPYALFLSGSKSLLRIENPEATGDRELIVFRDSFGSSIVPLLAGGYAKITLVDIRYISPELLGRFLEFDKQDVLFLYSTTVLNSSNTLR